MRRDDPTVQDIIQQLNQMSRMEAEYPLDIEKNGDVYHLKWRGGRPCWVRITGHITNYSSGYLPLNHYSGIEQVSRIGMSASEDLNSGMKFNDKLPLLAMDGNTEIPDNALVYATPAPSGTHYEFVWAKGSMSTCNNDHSGSGCGPCVLPVCELFECVDGEANVRDACIGVVDQDGNYIGSVVLVPGDGTCLPVPTPCDS